MSLVHYLAPLVPVAVLVWHLLVGRRTTYVRRTNKEYEVGSVVKHDGRWHRVVRVEPTKYGAPHDSFFGDLDSDVTLKELDRREATVWEVMES